MTLTKERAGRLICVPLLLLFARDAAAHSFGVMYSLPIPFWMYAYGAGATLAVSFALVGYFVNAKTAHQNFRTRDLTGNRIFSALTRPEFIGVLRTLSVCALALTIAAGLFGNRSAYANFAMTFFWIAFALGFTYLTAVVGDVYAIVNPWRVLCEWAELLKPGALAPLVRYPTWLGYWPALALYVAYIWIELFAHMQPRSLGFILIAYTAITLGGAKLFGKDVWLRHGEFFAVFLRLIAKMAPFERVRDADGGHRFLLRQPFIGLLRDSADHPSLVLFVLFMLSSTAFDGAHETLPWMNLFWKGIYPLVAPLVGALSSQPYGVATELYYVWQWAMLILSPLLYFGVYIFFVWMTKMITDSPMSIRCLAMRFAYTLIPIAFVYNVSHYYTLLITEGPNFVKLASDPLSNGWNIFGTRNMVLPPVIPDPDFTWHMQVWLILAGHIVSVYLSHLEALKLFPSNRSAAKSQVPMLFLMVILTTAGLWILSLPIASGQVIIQPLPPPSS
jgi:hypothetical protein